MKVVFFSLEPKTPIAGVERRNAGRRWYRLRAMPDTVIYAPDFETAEAQCLAPADAACIVHDDGAVQWRILTPEQKGVEYVKNAIHRHRKGRKEWVVFGENGVRFDPRKY
ncbi:MAG: hypothetical protein HDQ88_07030 [Clostridia bacterium]|nr:hypothetical protein [Clostridia bacterium]